MSFRQILGTKPILHALPPRQKELKKNDTPVI